MAEIDVLIDGLETLNEPDPDDRLPAIETSAVSVGGDLRQLGKHRMLCGDALIPENYESQVKDRRRDAGRLRTCRVSASTTVAVSLLGTLTRMVKRECRSTRVAMWLLPVPLSRSPSQ
jgi:hypothetical protein